METLKLLQDYFPTAVFTGKCLVFISEDWRVELTEHKDTDFSKWGDRFAENRSQMPQPGDELPVIRVRIYKKALDGDFIMGHYEDFQLPSLGELAEQIEKYVQSAIGRNIRET
ncbi:MAG: hypothetical protein MUO33_11515 [Sedimentisphaerales bacterium]|jgi:hypothetical protein|nr:hypothetical protein [Sedimentisphaerales bacterium]